MHIFLTSFSQVTGWEKPLPDLDSEQTLIMVFGDPDISPYQQALNQLRSKYPKALMTGCSSIASIYDDCLLEEGLIVSIVRFRHTRMQRFLTELGNNASETSLRAGKEIAQALNNPDLKGILLLADGLYSNGCTLAQGINENIGRHISIVGGLASDRMDFQKTWVLQDNMPAYRLVSAIGFYGDNIVMHSAARDGWMPFGPERVATRAEGKILYEIDGIPALTLYKEYLGDKVDELPGIVLHYPLTIWQEDKSRYVVRTILGIDEETQSLTLASDIPQDSNIQLMYGNFKDLVEGAEAVADTLSDKLESDKPVLAFAISCAARRLVMHADTDQELEAIMDNIPEGSRQIGFYSYGEIAPASSEGGCALHNESMTLAVIQERSD